MLKKRIAMEIMAGLLACSFIAGCGGGGDAAGRCARGAGAVRPRRRPRAGDGRGGGWIPAGHLSPQPAD